jgi:ATP phosphoribosyltransferase regulatory subunit
VLVAEGIASAHAAKLREEGYVVVYALSEYGNDEEEAKRLGCSHICRDGKLKDVK